VHGRLLALPIMLDGLGSGAADIHARFPGHPVACYVNGLYAWSPAQEALFARKVRISVEPGQPDAARVARVLDTERYDATPLDAAPFIRARDGAGHRDATIYCSLSTIAAVVEACGDVVVPRWWLAWYWERPGVPSLDVVRAEAARYGLPAGAEIWACQYATYPLWDTSVVFGLPDFSR
jgi:hypothetical protein